MDESLKEFLKECAEIQAPRSFISFLEQPHSNENSLVDPNSFEIIPGHSNVNSYGVSSESNTNEDLSTFISQTSSFSTDIPLSPADPLEIIAQPNCAPVRYRKDYLPPNKRRDSLINKNPRSSYTGPAVRIRPEYLDPRRYSIGVSLATLMHEKTGCCYIHPYELESIDHEGYNDRSNNIVWYPIEAENFAGLKSFPDLRIVRKKEDDLQSYGDLRPFHSYNVNLLNTNVQMTLSKRQIVTEYNLKNARLAFFIGQKMNINDQFPRIDESHYIIFSDEMILVPSGATGEDDNTIESTVTSDSFTPPVCGVHKYAPRSGYSAGGDEMLISLTKKPEEKKYGKIQIIFQSIPSDPVWSVKIDTTKIEVKYQAISFPTPAFPWPINTLTAVNVTVQQGDTVLALLQYFYIPQFLCATCQAHSMNISQPLGRSYSNKRTKSSLNSFDDQSDAIVPLSPSNPVFQPTTTESESNSSNTTPEPSASPNLHENQIMHKLHESIELLFRNNDYQPLLRTCRAHVQKRPELLHEAIDKNYSDLVSTFVPIAGIDLVQKKNQQGETVLLQAARLNRFKIVQAVLGRKESDTLFQVTNPKRQNICHVLALNTDSDEILQFIINHLLKNSMDIAKQFDQGDEDGHTPLQLAILNNNLPVTRLLLKYFDKNICKTSDHVNENLLHLAVRHGDLAMLKYLLDEGQLIEQGNQTSSDMTPLELAQSMNRTDMMDYLTAIYSPTEKNKEENTNDDQTLPLVNVDLSSQ